jgi:hypothetical protein
MNIFVKSTPAPQPRTSDAKKMAYFYAIILTVFALGQLFAFNDFLNLLDSFWLPGGKPIATLIGGVIVASEVFAIPFLIGMALSPLMRYFSMFLSWLTPALWLFIALWIHFTENSITNIGFLGTKLSIMPGAWTILICVALGILSAWASWGLWPGKRK